MKTEHDFSVIGYAIDLSVLVIEECQEGEFGHVKNINENNEITCQVMGHAPNDNQEVYIVATFNDEDHAKTFSDILNALNINELKAQINRECARRYCELVNYMKHHDL
ncbi:hypothetical protein GL273_20965 [Aeromonas jandaei]|uniref:hypothetical protein n=1 Tax=Aeromonas jandaei TaxID=650 RepID=UPI001C5B2AC2|nr:hypothetical protein [Aeromonas jandaei]MBW3808232.1 hypothetical protein [Aeromonas jandaei]